jgi:predicted SAM-dependent methyltransferase
MIGFYLNQTGNTMVIDHILSKKPKRCAVCKQEHYWNELHSMDGHFVCEECLRLIREDGIVLPDKLNSD